MAWIKGKSPGDLRWYITFVASQNGSSSYILPLLADPHAKGGWAEGGSEGDRWEPGDRVTHYHKIEPWPDPPAEGE